MGNCDATVFRCKKTGVVFLHHVDDFNITGPDEWLDKFFEDGLNHYLKPKVGPTKNVGDRIGWRQAHAFITRSDSKRINTILSLLHLEEAKEVGSPGRKLELTEENKQLLPEDRASVYRSAVGCAMYLAQDTRDIGFAAKELARRRDTYRSQGTRDLVSVAQVRPGEDPPGEWRLEAYVDSETRKSTGGEVYTLRRAEIDSCVQTQPGVPTSSGEAEYRVMVRGAQHLTFLQNLCVHDFGVGVLIPKMWTDSSAALQLSKRLGLWNIDVTAVTAREIKVATMTIGCEWKPRLPMVAVTTCMAAAITLQGCTNEPNTQEGGDAQGAAAAAQPAAARQAMLNAQEALGCSLRLHSPDTELRRAFSHCLSRHTGHGETVPKAQQGQVLRIGLEPARRVKALRNTGWGG